jgi:hypothetical protein
LVLPGKIKSYKNENEKEEEIQNTLTRGFLCMPNHLITSENTYHQKGGGEEEEERKWGCRILGLRKKTILHKIIPLL